ncbi:hypothetical protein AMECASPLE_035110 [Ameca splendens]|uniref:Uncharacterized protein n=1 Tax=Ameca splendens TaxID=208324 RepID=A0ABV0XWK9_9TELE
MSFPSHYSVYNLSGSHCSLLDQQVTSKSILSKGIPVCSTFPGPTFSPVLRMPANHSIFRQNACSHFLHQYQQDSTPQPLVQPSPPPISAPLVLSPSCCRRHHHRDASGPVPEGKADTSIPVPEDLPDSSTPVPEVLGQSSAFGSPDFSSTFHCFFSALLWFPVERVSHNFLCSTFSTRFCSLSAESTPQPSTAPK